MPPAEIDPENRALLRGLRELAENAARIGGSLARDWFHRSYDVRRKPDGSEVTDADEAAQAAVVSCLLERRPDDGIIAEESESESEPEAQARDNLSKTKTASPSPTNTRLCWIIDPLDGTRNYVYGLPIYACSVAAMFGGYPIVGAIYDPQHDALYSVSRGDPLYLNGSPITANSTWPRTQSRRLLVGIPSSMHGTAYTLMRNWTSGVVVRNLGSTALHLMMVATGQLQAALISDGKLWDIAAGWAMVVAAGGVMTTLNGDDIFPLDVSRYAGESIPSLATRNAEMHTRLLPPGDLPF